MVKTKKHALAVPAIVFADIQAYLDAIADHATNDIDGSPHKRFWSGKYTDFINGTIPGVTSSGSPIPVGQPVPIIDKTTPLNSPFFLILKAGFAGKRQMPGGGPLITSAGYQVTTAAGKTVTGQQIQDDIASWLTNGFPEK